MHQEAVAFSRVAMLGLACGGLFLFGLVVAIVAAIVSSTRNRESGARSGAVIAGVVGLLLAVLTCGGLGVAMYWLKAGAVKQGGVAKPGVPQDVIAVPAELPETQDVEVQDRE